MTSEFLSATTKALAPEAAVKDIPDILKEELAKMTKALEALANALGGFEG